MSATPWYKWYPIDYLRDTAHLTIIEDGAYRRMIDHVMSTRSGIEPDRVYRIAGAVTPEERAAVDRVVFEFTVMQSDGLHIPRCDKELEKLAKYRDGQREKARHRWDAGADATAYAGVMPGDMPDRCLPEVRYQKSDTRSQIPERSTKSSKATDVAARRLLGELNSRAGRNFKAVEAHLRLIKARINEHGEEVLRTMIVMKCREWKNDPKMSEYLRPGTLFNATKCADYVGRVGTFK